MSGRARPPRPRPQYITGQSGCAAVATAELAGLALVGARDDVVRTMPTTRAIGAIIIIARASRIFTT